MEMCLKRTCFNMFYMFFLASGVVFCPFRGQVLTAGVLI